MKHDLTQWYLEYLIAETAVSRQTSETWYSATRKEPQNMEIQYL